jgi:hypothetical protein
MEHTTIAVDLAKSVFQVAVSHRTGRIDTEKRLSRERFLAYFAQQPPATVHLPFHPEIGSHTSNLILDSR